MYTVLSHINAENFATKNPCKNEDFNWTGKCLNNGKGVGVKGMDAKIIDMFKKKKLFPMNAEEFLTLQNFCIVGKYDWLQNNVCTKLQENYLFDWCSILNKC